MYQQIPWPGWETTRLIGRGSFGAVYEIQREIRGRTEHAALKVISIPHNENEIQELRADGYDDESITQYFADSLEKIEDEYAMMADLRGHSKVVYCDDIRTVQHDDGFGWDIYIKMELLTPLKSYIGDMVTDEQIIKLGMDICDALKLCDELRIVHRDIKPENIFVSRSGDFKLGDFGIARTMEGATGGTKTGTYDYMAPEVYNNQPYHTQADIYSLGLVMYWLLNNRTAPFLPQDGKRPTPSAKTVARARRFDGEQIPAPSRGSGELKRIVLKACEFDPKDRYQSAKEMLAALNALWRGEEETAKNASSAPASMHVPEPMDEDDATVGPEWERAGTARSAEIGRNMPVDPRPVSGKKTDSGSLAAPHFPEESEEAGTIGPVFQPSHKPKSTAKYPVVKSAVAVRVLLIAVLCVPCAEVFIERIISLNIAIAYRFGKRTNAIADALMGLIGATNKYLRVYNRFTVELTPDSQNADTLIILTLIALLLIIVSIWCLIGVKHIKKTIPQMACVVHRISQLGITVALYVIVGEALLCRSITGMIMMVAEYESIRKPVGVIINVLTELVGGADDTVVVVNRFGMILNPSLAATNLDNACYLILPSILVLVVPIALFVMDVVKLVIAKRKKARAEG